jgi:hypothetical protein
MLAGAGGSDMAMVSELKEELGACPLAKPMRQLSSRRDGELFRRIPLTPEAKVLLHSASRCSRMCQN